MATLISTLAVIMAIASVLAAVGHLGYLALLRSAAHRRAGGEPVARYVDGRWPIAGGTAAVSLLALLLAAGSAVPVNILAIVLAVASGTAATSALRSTQSCYRIGR